jgi:hypothetical protein
VSEDVREMFCSMSDGQIDAHMHPLIRAWSEPPTAIQVLEVLDACIHGALASGFVVAALQALYDIACKREGTTHEEVVKGASWRDTPRAKETK